MECWWNHDNWGIRREACPIVILSTASPYSLAWDRTRASAVTGGDESPEQWHSRPPEQADNIRICGCGSVLNAATENFCRQERP